MTDHLECERGDGRQARVVELEADVGSSRDALARYIEEIEEVGGSDTWRASHASLFDPARFETPQ